MPGSDFIDLAELGTLAVFHCASVVSVDRVETGFSRCWRCLAPDMGSYSSFVSDDNRDLVLRVASEPGIKVSGGTPCEGPRVVFLRARFLRRTPKRYSAACCNGRTEARIW